MPRIPYVIASAAVMLALAGCHGHRHLAAQGDKNPIEERTSPPTIRTQREEPTTQSSVVGVVDVPPNTGGSVIEPTHW